MAKKIKHSDLIASDVFKPATKNAEALLVVTKELKKEFREILKVSKKKVDNNFLKTAKDIQKLDTESKKVIKTTKELKTVQEAESKVLKQLKASTDEQVKGKLRLQAANKKQRDILKDEIVLLDKNAGTLQKLNARNRALRRQRDGLNLSTEKGRKRLKQLNDIIDKNNKKIAKNSDSLKKQKLNVGNYTNSIKEAAGASGLFGGVLGKLSTIQATLGALTAKNSAQTGVNTTAKVSNAAATKSMTIAQRGLTLATNLGSKALKLFKIALASTGIGLLVVALGSLVAFFQRSQDGADSLSKGMAGLQAGIDVLIDRFEQVGRGLVLVFSGLGDQLKKAQISAKIFFLELGQFEVGGKIINDNTKEVEKLNKELEGLTGVGDGLDLIAAAFKGIGSEIANDVVQATKLKQLTIELTREQKLFEAEQANSLTAVKKLTIIVKDKLQADVDRLAAVKEINEIEIKTAEKQLALQERALAASLDSISSDKSRLKLGAEQLDFIERIKNGQIEAAEAVKLAADFTLSSAAGEEALFDIVQKIVEQEQARQSLLDKQSTTAKRTAAITREIATKNAKALIEEGKLRLLIAKDEKELISDRVTAFNEAAQKQIESFRVQADANIINEREFNARRLEIIKLTQQQIDKLFEKSLDKDIAARTAAELKKAKTINQIDQEAQAQKIKEIEGQRERELSEAFKTGEEVSAAKISALKNTIEQEFILRKRAAKDAADFELTNDKLTAEERELIQLKLQGNLADLEGERLDAVSSVNDLILDANEKAVKETSKKIKEGLNQIADEFKDFFKEASDARIDILDKELSATQGRLDQLRALAEKGSEDANNNLANEIQREAELQRAREAELQKQKTIELGLTALKAFTANLESGDGNALGNTIGQITALIGFISSISGSFKDGTEDTGTVGKALDKDGGRMAILHNNERVLTKEQNQKVGNLSNEELANMAYMHHNGKLEHRARANEILGANTFQTNEQLLTAVENLEKAIRANKPVKENWYFDGRREMLIHEVKKVGKTERTHMKKTGLFS